MSTPFDLGTRRIILLDDGEEVLEVFGAVLRFHLQDPEILTFTCGLEALDEITRKPPDLLVMDWCRPHDNGEDMLAELADRKETFPMLVASGSATKEMVERAATPWQRVAVIQKPCRWQDFLTTVVSLLISGTPAQPVQGRKRPSTHRRNSRDLGKFIVCDPRVSLGAPTLRGTNIEVWKILEDLLRGIRADKIVKSWGGRFTRDAITEAVCLVMRTLTNRPSATYGTVKGRASSLPELTQRGLAWSRQAVRFRNRLHSSP